MDWQKDPELQKSLEEVVSRLEMKHVLPERIFCFRTSGSKSRAYARIWSFPKIFQQVLKIEPAYVIEVLSQKYDRLSPDDKIKVIDASKPLKNVFENVRKEVDRLLN